MLRFIPNASLVCKSHAFVWKIKSVKIIINSNTNLKRLEFYLHNILIEAFIMMNQMKNTISGHDAKKFVQNLTVNCRFSQCWYPKMWMTSDTMLFLETFNNCLSTKQTIVEFLRVFQWDRMILNGCNDSSFFIEKIFASFGYVVNWRWFFFPFIIEILICFR